MCLFVYFLNDQWFGIYKAQQNLHNSNTLLSGRDALSITFLLKNYFRCFITVRSDIEHQQTQCTEVVKIVKMVQEADLGSVDLMSAEQVRSSIILLDLSPINIHQ